MKQDIPGVFTEIGGYSGGIEFAEFVTEWINSAPSLFPDLKSETDINYSEEDCIILLKKVLAWWEKEKEKFNILGEGIFMKILKLTCIILRI